MISVGLIPGVNGRFNKFTGKNVSKGKGSVLSHFSQQKGEHHVRERSTVSWTRIRLA